MSETLDVTHLIVEDGPDQGRALSIPPGGARLGRAEGNDLVLNDGSVSRFQCRFYFKDGSALAVADLASTNETLVNGEAVEDRRLTVGDRIEVGGSVLKVVCDTLESGTPVAAPAGTPEVDLGLHPVMAAPAARSAGAPNIRWILWGVTAAVLAGAAALVIPRAMRRNARPTAGPTRPATERVLWVEYEKVEADADNIFRYHLALRDGILRVQIDSLADDRHVVREEPVPRDLIDDVARTIEQSGFFDLSSEYSGMAPDVWQRFDLDIVLDRRAHRVRVTNRIEPDRFRAVRTTIEEFARNQIGLFALALPPERLVELAREAWLQGRKLFDEREVRHDNLARAIRAFTEAETLLETVEPKPDFFRDAVAAREECVRMLQERYESVMFRAQQAVRLQDWVEANRHLRIVLEMIQDRSDERYETAYRQLLDVQRRLERQRR